MQTNVHAVEFVFLLLLLFVVVFGVRMMKTVVMNINGT